MNDDAILKTKAEEMAAKYELIKGIKDEIKKRLNVRARPSCPIDVVARQIGDFYLACYIYLDDNEVNKTVSYAAMTWDELDNVGMSEEEAFYIAFENTFNAMGSIVGQFCDNRSEEGFTQDFFDFQDIFSEEFEKELINHDLRIGVIVSSDYMVNGATSVLLPKVQDRIAKLFDDDFYISFTSKHEAIVHPVSVIDDPKMLVEVLIDTLNDAVLDKDVLSTQVYIYKRDTKKFEVVEMSE